jgi:SAM-dependent methyltransferase
MGELEYLMLGVDLELGFMTWQQSTNHQHFFGVDISPVFQPLENEHKNGVTNVGFLQRNILEGLPFPVDTFDFVYQRFLTFAFSATDWVQDIKELVRVTKSGGWIEIIEAKYLKNKGSATKNFTDAVHSFHLSKNILTNTERPDLIKLLNDTNQVTDIHLIEKSAPVGKWGGRVGELLALDTNNAMLSLKPCIKAYLGDNEFDEILAEHNAQLDEYKTYLVTQRFFCRKL